MRDHHASPGASSIRRRRWPYVLVLLSLPVLVAIGIYVYLDVDAEAELRAVLAETDRLDPRWRLDDVDADRAVVPDARNSAGPAMAAKLLLPKNWPFWDYPSSEQDPPDAEEERRALQKSFWDLEPQHQLNEGQVTALRAEMERAAPALA